MSHPLPYAKVPRLYDHVSRVAVVEELDPFFEEQVRALGLPVIGKAAIPADGELDQEIVFRALEPYVLRKPPRRRRPVMPPAPRLASPPQPAPGLPVRPPVLCPGCSHRSVYAALRKRRLAPMGDIGCYTLGALPPLLALDSCLCMGASIGMMAGFNKALGRKAAVGVIGDSTFFHSGITPLIDAFYNEVEAMVVILDNRTTAMTGHQGHPGTGLHPDRAQGPQFDIQRLCEGIGVRCVTVDATDHKALDVAIKEEAKASGLGVIIALAPCVLMTREKAGEVLVDEDRCNLCGVCVDLGCPRSRPARTPCRSSRPAPAAACASRCAAAAAQPRRVRGRAVNGTTTVSLVGVGGQGILLGAAVLAETAAAAGLEVKASEVKGMAQRGGSVLSTVRFGEHVWSPVGPHADVVIATELLEGIRGLGLLGSRGTMVCACTTRITPGSVLRREEDYPDDLAGAAAMRGLRLVTVDAEGVALEAGTIRAVNVALLGAASTVLPFTRSSGGAASRPPSRRRSSKSICARSSSDAPRSRARRSSREGHAAHRVPREPQRSSRRSRRHRRPGRHQHPRVLHDGGCRVRHRPSHPHRP